MTTKFKMQKIKITVLALVGAAGLHLAASAQQLEIKGVPRNNFRVVQPIEGKGYYVLYRSEMGEEGMDIYAMHVLDNELKTVKQHMLEVPATAKLSATGKNGQATYLSFYDQGNAVTTLFTLDAGFNLHRQIVPLEAYRKHRPAGNARLLSAGQGQFALLQPVANDTSGYRLKMLGSNLRTQWSTIFFPNNLTQTQVMEAGAGKDLVAIAQSESYLTGNPKSKAPRERKTDYKLLGIDPANGNIKFTHNLADGNTFYQPTNMQSAANGGVVASGTYFNDSQPKHDKATGAFIMFISPDGNVNKINIPWSRLSELSGDAFLADKISKGKEAVIYHDLLVDAKGKVTILAETMQGKNMFVISAGPDATAANGYAIARPNLSKQYNSIYRGTVPGANGASLVYTNVENTTQFAYVTPLGQSQNREYRKSEATMAPLPEVPPHLNEAEKLSQSIDMGLESFRKKLETVIVGETQVLPQYSPDPNTGFVVSSDKNALLYRYDPLGRRMLLQLSPVK